MNCSSWYGQSDWEQASRVFQSERSFKHICGAIIIKGGRRLWKLTSALVDRRQIDTSASTRQHMVGNSTVIDFTTPHWWSELSEERKRQSHENFSHICCSLAFITSRIAQSGKLPVLNLLRGWKSEFLPRRVDWLHRPPINSHLAKLRGTCPCKISRQSVYGVANTAPKKLKISTFLVKSHPQGQTLWPITTIVRGFYTFLTISCISVLHLRWFASLVMELLLRNHASVIYPEFYSAPCRKNYALDRKMIAAFCNGFNVLCHRTRFGEDCTTHASSRCKNMMFVFLSHTLVFWHAVRSSGHVWTSIAVNDAQHVMVDTTWGKDHNQNPSKTITWYHNIYRACQKSIP